LTTPALISSASADASHRVALARIVACCLVAVVTLMLGAAQAFAQSASPVPGLRLPRDVVPLTYDPRLRVDPAADVFSGTIEIKVRVLEPTDLVWLNAKNLTILEARAVVLGPQEEAVGAATVPGNDNVIGLRFAKVLPAGEARLWISYTGLIERVGAVGLFRQQEGDHWYAVTQFEPLDARRVFPSFDEPDRKAEWKLALEVPASMRAFANMPVESDRATTTGWREVTFQRTPPLPSYLIAFAVGEFDVRDGGKAGMNRTPISIIAPKGRAAEAAYAAANTGAILAATEKYFGRPYPFPKLDLLAYPKSTFGGAMENPGLITFTAHILLARPDEMSPSFEQRFVGVTAHEIAHMWFGDYVTMAWWNDLWLNESFASWMASLTTAELRPDWPRGGWRSRQRSKAMEFDRLVSARRIRQPVTEYGEVRAAFDSITYAKGESILAMFEQWLGPDKFREGVRRYMAKFAWGNATAEDFFAALAATDDALVPAFQGYVERAGVPLLRVGLDCSAAPALTLTQERFVPVGVAAAAGERWVFPACFEYGDAGRGQQICTLVRDATQKLALPTNACPQWVVANRTGLGYYLPRLTPALYAALPKAERVLANADYELLLGDMDMLARSGAIGYQDVLPVAAQQANNPDGRAARRAFDVAGGIPQPMIAAANDARFAAWIRRNYGARARSLGWLASTGDSPDIQRLREIALPLVAERGHDAALARAAQRLAQRWLTHRKAVPPETRGIVLVTAARTADKDAPRLFDALLEIARKTSDQNERDDVLAALGAFRDPVLLERALALMADPRINPRDGTVVLRQAMAHPATRPAALAWFAGHVDLLARAPREQQGYFATWAEGACTAGERAQFVALFETRVANFDAGQRKYRESLEKIDLCLALRAAQEASLNAFLVTVK
jgi:alanyl aminopeptidase